MWTKKRTFIRKIQQSTPSTLTINLPIKWAKLNRLEKGDLVSCKMIKLKNGHVAMIVDKIIANPTTLEELEVSWLAP